MKKILLILFLLSGLMMHASDHDFKTYNRLTDRAEMMIIDGWFDKALPVYDSAFAVKKVPFAKDLYNASVCALKAKQMVRALALCHRLAEKGVGGDFFSVNGVYKELYNRPEWPRLVTRASLVRDSIRTYRRELLNTIDSLVAKDQRYNRMWRQSGMSGEKQQEMHLAGDTICRQLMGLIGRYGFPSEDVIGATLNPDGTLSNMLPFDVIIIHNYQRGFGGDSLFSGSLRKALREGKISPDYYATIQDAGSNMGSRPYYGTLRYYYQYKCRIYLDRFNQERSGQIELNRASIGLCGTQDLLKKVIYRTVHPESNFKITVDLTVFGSYADKESEALGLQQSVLMLDHIPGCTEK